MKTHALSRYTHPVICLAFFAAIAALTACDRMDPQSAPAAPAVDADAGKHTLSPSQLEAFDQEAIAIKAQVSDPDLRDNALQDLRARFGFPAHASVPFAPEIPDFSELPDLAPLPSIAGNSDNPEAQGKALSKAPPTGTWKPAKSYFGPFPFTVVADEIVAKHTKITITTKRIDASLDPVLVVFHRPFLDSPNNRYVNVLAVIDDVGNSLEPSFTWTNPNDVSTGICMIMYAYGSGFTGKGSLTYNIYGLTTKVSGRVDATAIPLNKYLDIGGCTGPVSSGVRLRLNKGKYGGAGALLVNSQTIYGAHARDKDVDVDMFEVVQGDNGSFMLPYLIDKSNGFSNIDNRYSASFINMWQCP